MTTELKKYTDYDYEQAVEAKDYTGAPVSTIASKSGRNGGNLVSEDSLKAMEQLKQRCEMMEVDFVKQK